MAKKVTPFLKLDQPIYKSVEFQNLSMAAERVLWQLIQKHNGYNNGAIPAGQKTLMGRPGLKSPKTIGNAIGELVEAGFIVITRKGRENRCRCIGLRWLPPGIALPDDLQEGSWRLWRPGLSFKHEKSPARHYQGKKS